MSKFDVDTGRAACIAKWDFGYKLSVCSRMGENSRRPFSGWSVCRVFQNAYLFQVAAGN
jgi:hypothetical protein